MNEYVVSVIISENGKIMTEQLIEAKDKDEAREKAIAVCHADGIKTFGISYCDWWG